MLLHTLCKSRFGQWQTTIQMQRLPSLFFSVKQRSNQKKVMALKKQAIDTNSKQILGFVCGKTDTNTFKRLYQQLNTHNIQLFFSDYWKSYRQVILKPKHITSKAQTFTIEGYNSLIRHFIARFTRKSKCYSKSEKNDRKHVEFIIC